MTTGLKLIKKAMQKAGILTKTQNPTADEANDALDALNDLLASLSNNSMVIYARKFESFSLTPGKAFYTIGTGGELNTPRPIKIVSAVFNLGGTDYPVGIINDEAYLQDTSVKTVPGQPFWMNFNNDYPLATLKFYPVPTTSGPLKMLTEKALPSFTLNDEVALPPGWTRMLIHNLAIEIAGDYEQEVPATVQRIAVSSMMEIKRAIQRARSFDSYPATPQTNNVYTGWNA